ncbi:hypothetical protein TUM12370_18070 [Salmonella enterica subsp. enterica serovar Choleraesuis]|nr:hypothetical protein TUM12370_18070 [Salmonella enterica subsp. enterica serovar Choleraesuis]
MKYSEIPLSADNQQFTITLANTVYQLRVLWRDPYWFMDLRDSTGVDIISGIPLVTGADLLEQYDYLGLEFHLMVVCDDGAGDMPTQNGLGTTSHLYLVTE